MSKSNATTEVSGSFRFIWGFSRLVTMNTNYFRVIIVKELTLSCYIVVVVMVNVFAVTRHQCYCCTVWNLTNKKQKHTVSSV